MWSNISSCSSKSPKAVDLKLRKIESFEPGENETNIHDQSSFFREQQLGANTAENGFEVEVRREIPGSPLMRYKHAVCSAPTGFIYIHGGRFGNLPLDDDVWRFDPHHNTWLQLETSGSRPPSLQEHTLVEYNDRLYLFGGQVCASSDDDSFWRLDLMNSEWRSLSMKSSRFGAHLGPTNRRGHSAVVYGDSMYIFGGFEDFRGSSAQLWEFNFLNQRWELRNLSSTSACHPEPRHSHSAIVYEDSMYVYGGLSNLKALSDLWRWSWREKRWFKERTRGNSPRQLHGHTAIQAFGSMFVFGGERNGRATRSLWRLNLSNLTWQKIRPKGPRPNPTTWHGAIANPLGILDEANYIVEGDPDLLKSAQHSSYANFSYSNNHNNMTQGPKVETAKLTPVAPNRDRPLGNLEKQNVQQQAKTMKHSRSISAEIAGKSTAYNQERTKRRSRLSFLRGRRGHSRTKSTYELKQLKSSASAIELIAHKASNSIEVGPSNTVNNLPQDTSACGQATTMIENGTNTKILDALDTDIKEMFQRATSPTGTGNSFNDQTEQRNSSLNVLEHDEQMSIDNPIQSDSRTTRSMFTSNSQYQTAVQATDSTLADLNMSSQRTSYAYTTPPSELNTLTRDSASIQRNNGLTSNASTFLNASNVADTFASGYNRRDNRPKSEIVQSLIDRADARIKHLYTPFFNQPNGNGPQSVVATRQSDAILDNVRRTRGQMNVNDGDLVGGRERGKNSHLLDRSKRHTIHQTMTYYNLYFSEDNRSDTNDSPPSDAEQSKKQREFATADNSKSRATSRMVRDDLSSSTIKAEARSTGTSSGAIIGVHGEPSPMDQESQLSLETNTSSDSRTICNDHSNRALSGNEPSNTFGGNSLQSSIPNALTARRDTAESCDNTSLSFSVIAEFEEDDMLQYSSPTDTAMVSTNEQNRMGNHIIQYMSVNSDELDGDRQRRSFDPTLESQNLEQHNDIRSDREKVAHKSTSSGYDSISACGNSSQIRGLSRNANSNAQRTGVSNMHEDSSFRTDYSLEFATTETSPEQSAVKCKKINSRTAHGGQGRHQFANNGAVATTTTTSSTTADSLTFISDGFDSSNSCQVAKSLSSSPPDKGRLLQNIAVETHRKLPLMSRSKFFSSKSKSKNRYWQLCMFVIGGKQGGSNGVNEPITIWRLYI